MKALFICSLFLFCAACSSPSAEKSSYRVARDPSWYPLVVPGLEASLLGFSDDLLNNIAKVESINIELVLSSWDALNFGLMQNRYEAICTSMPMELSNAENFSFSDNYLPLGPVLVVPVSSKNTLLENFLGMEVGILAGSIIETQIVEKFPTLSIHTYSNYSSLLDELVAGKIDAALMPLLTADMYVRDLYSEELKTVGNSLNDDGLKVATLYEENIEFIKKFNEGLKKIKENGLYETLLKKWRLK
jgi:ABC-type amino acid transport substrate-binding protein